MGQFSMNINLPNWVGFARQWSERRKSFATKTRFVYSYCGIIGCHHPATAGTERSQQTLLQEARRPLQRAPWGYTKAQLSTDIIEPQEEAAPIGSAWANSWTPLLFNFVHRSSASASTFCRRP